MFKKFNLLRPILAILIIFIPLYPKFPLASVTGTYVAIRLDDIIVSVSLLFWLLYQIKHRFPILKEPVVKLLIPYLLAIVASFINAYLINQTEPTNILILHLLRRFEYISLFFLTISTTKSFPHLKEFYAFLALTTMAVLAYGYGQKYFSLPVISTMNSEFSKGQLLQMNNWTRISSTFAGHYDLAAFLSIVLVLIGGVILLHKNIYLRVANIILWLLAFNVLTLTASRVSIFAFYGGMCLLIFLLRRYIWIVPVTLVFGFSLVNSKDLNQRLLATIPALKNQFFTSTTKVTPTPIAIATPTKGPIAIVSPVTVRITPKPTIIRKGPIEEQIPIDADVGVARSGEIRFNAEWPRAITAFKKNLLLGTGLGSITLATDNDYLRLLGESGLLGFITFMLIFVYFTYFTYKNRSRVSIIFFSAMVTFLVNATLIDVFEASKTAYLFWIMMGFYYQILSTPRQSK